MEMKRCEHGHYYDPEKHSACPNCGINIDLDFSGGTIAKTMPKMGTMPEKQLRSETVEPVTVPRGFGGSESKTVGLLPKQLGIDPVVGWLVCIEGPERGRDYRLRSERNFIGRSERMNVCIATDETISRENHAIVSYNPKNGSFKIIPGDGRGLVYLNGDEVDLPKELRTHDCIELGQTKLLFVPLCGEFKWE
ncbi:MAG TPA: FHA domain-containing protein [Bacillota bacterium]|nr:FHA domain-containing protein [Bacillota bacterium]